MTTYFKDQGKRGENAELQEELASMDKIKKRDAVKKVIRDMTLGKDVAGLFTAVVNCMMTPHLEVRKLVYLYLINYAKTQPDLAIMAVNGFVKDCGDPNPLIRALAVRTMGCIRVEQISEYLCEPLRRALKDSDPYVRKTAAICVAKLYEISPDLVMDQGFIGTLNDLLGDSNPMVVSNCIAALAEISKDGKPAYTLNSANILKLLAVLNECSEWGQIFILDVLSQYTPTHAQEAENIVERVKPRLQHANSAVVLSATKVIIRFLDVLTDSEKIKTYLRSLGPPLVTLMSGEPEIQYVALRNIQLICQKRPAVLHSEVKVFFCKYNDPIYVKMEKLDVLVMLANDRNIDQVLMEFKEYATEIDDEFVRKSVRSIGRCAIKLDNAAERCVNVLVELIQTKVNYVVQEAIIVIRNIFRKYPNKYESVIGTLCECLDTLDESEAKASMIWIVGEYAERIDNAAELLENFMETFPDDGCQVQLQMLTAVVKLFLKRPSVAQDMVKRVLALATQESDNPDLRDRGYVYWRLLSTNPEQAKQIVLAEKPVIEDDTNLIESGLLEDLVANLATLSSVYHKRPAQFVDVKKKMGAEEFDEADEPEGGGRGDIDDMPRLAAPAPIVDMLSLDDPVPSASSKASNLEDLLGLSSAPAPAPSKPSTGGDILDLLGGGAAAPPPAAAQTMPAGAMHTAAASHANHPVVLQAAQGGGMMIKGAVVQRDGKVMYELCFVNQSQQPLGGIALQINKNTFGLAPSAPLTLSDIPPGGSANAILPLAVDPGRHEVKPAPAGMGIQVAVKNNSGVFYYNDTVQLSAILDPNYQMAQGDYLSTWSTIPTDISGIANISGFPTNDVNAIEAKLKEAHLCLVARRVTQPGTEALYMAGKTLANDVFLLEMQVAAAGGARVASRSKVASLASNIPNAIQEQLKLSMAPAHHAQAATAPAAPAKPAYEDPLAGLF